MNDYSAYYKISDILFKFDSTTELRFNTVLSYVDKYGNTRYSHSEFEYPLTRNGKKEIVRSVTRRPNYFLSIENRALSGVKEFLKIKGGDFYVLRESLSKVMALNNKDIVMQLENGQVLVLSRSKNNKYGLVIDCNSMYKIQLESIKLLEFLNIMNEINMLMMWNMHMSYISTSNYLGNLNLKSINNNSEFNDVKTNSVGVMEESELFNAFKVFFEVHTVELNSENLLNKTFDNKLQEVLKYIVYNYYLNYNENNRYIGNGALNKLLNYIQQENSHNLFLQLKDFYFSHLMLSKRKILKACIKHSNNYKENETELILSCLSKSIDEWENLKLILVKSSFVKIQNFKEILLIKMKTIIDLEYNIVNAIQKILY